MTSSSVDREPVPPVRVVETLVDKQNLHAVYVTVVFEDAAGERWGFSRGEFLSELKPMRTNSGGV